MARKVTKTIISWFTPKQFALLATATLTIAVGAVALSAKAYQNVANTSISRTYSARSYWYKGNSWRGRIGGGTVSGCIFARGASSSQNSVYAALYANGTGVVKNGYTLANGQSKIICAPKSYSNGTYTFQPAFKIVSGKVYISSAWVKVP